MKSILLGLAAVSTLTTFAHADDLDLTGTWSTVCTLSTMDNVSTRRSYTFNDPAGNVENVTVTVQIFEGNECEELTHSAFFMTTYTLGAVSGEGHAFDQTIHTVLNTPFTVQMTKNFNVAKYCGYGDWQQGVTRIVDNAVCLEQHFAPIQDSSLYTIIARKKDDAGKEYLALGDQSGENDGSSKDKRPKTLDAKYRLYKVVAPL